LEVDELEKFKGFVVSNKDGLFYKNDKEFVKDLDKAKEFNSKGTAKRVAQRIKGEVHELAY
jgi:hypothetical protein